MSVYPIESLQDVSARAASLDDGLARETLLGAARLRACLEAARRPPNGASRGLVARLLRRRAGAPPTTPDPDIVAAVWLAAHRLGLVERPAAAEPPDRAAADAVFGRAATALVARGAAPSSDLQLARAVAWGPADREVTVRLDRALMESGMRFSFVGPQGPLTSTSDPHIVLRALEPTPEPLQFELGLLPWGLNLLYHDRRTARAAAGDGTGDEVQGRATFGKAVLRPGDEGYRMAVGAGPPIVQRLPPYDITIHFQASDGRWSA